MQAVSRWSSTVGVLEYNGLPSHHNDSAQMASPPANSETLPCSAAGASTMSRVFPEPRSYLCFEPHHTTRQLCLLMILIHWPLGSWEPSLCACIWILSVSRSVQHSGDAHQMFVKARRKECSVVAIIHSLEQCFTQSRHSTDIVKWKETEKRTALIQRQEKQWAKSSHEIVK